MFYHKIFVLIGVWLFKRASYLSELIITLRNHRCVKHIAPKLLIQSMSFRCNVRTHVTSLRWYCSSCSLETLHVPEDGDKKGGRGGGVGRHWRVPSLWPPDDRYACTIDNGVWSEVWVLSWWHGADGGCEALTRTGARRSGAAAAPPHLLGLRDTHVGRC